MKEPVKILILFSLVSIYICSTQPIIAILANAMPDDVVNPEKTEVYASYVRWLEAAGANAIVIQPWISKIDLEDLLSKVNGVLFQGGGRTFNLTAPWETLAKKIINRVIQKNLKGEFIPLWVTCQGFELIHSIIANTTEVLGHYESYNIATPLEFDDDIIKKSKMFKYFSEDDLKSLRSDKTTAQFHHYGVSRESYDEYPLLKKYFQITSQGRDLNNKLSIASVEGKFVPIYGVQFHPEKLPYDRKPADSIPQFGHAIKISQNFGLFFVEEARKNTNIFPIAQKDKYNFIDTYVTKATLKEGIYYYFYNKSGISLE